MSNPSDYMEVSSESEDSDYTSESDEESEPESSDSEQTEEEEDGLIPVMESPSAISEKGGEGTSLCSSAGEDGQNSQGKEWNRCDIDGLFCPICLEPWSRAGDHHVSCLPCGHIFGFSCIKKWLQQGRTTKKCPQCKGKCTLKDVRKLFPSRVVAIDEESQKRIQYLEAKCISLEKKIAVSSTTSSSNVPKARNGGMLTNAQAVTQLRELLQSLNNLEERTDKAKTEVSVLLALLQELS